MKITILTFCLLIFLSAFPVQTFAIDFTVNTTTDLPDSNLGDGICLTSASNCSLRAAVQEANSLASNDRVFVPANLTVILTTANGGEIAIINNGALEIIGAGANVSTINGGTGTNRIFYTNSAIVIISGVTLTGGNGTGAFPSNEGGAIYAGNGALTLDRVHVTGNTAASGGGGVDFFEGGAHRIVNSTFSGNTASVGGGFINDGGTVTIVNSTVSGNSAENGGGGFFTDNSVNNSFGSVTLRNATVTNNTSSIGGGGVLQFGGALNFGNTIVTANIAIDNSYPEFELGGGSGTITSAGGNLVGDSAGDSLNTGFGVIAYQMTDLRDVNPALGILQNNGGATPTHSVSAGSPAIDAGLNALAVDSSNGNTALTTDQRGADFTRIVDGNSDAAAVVDIGAFEKQLGATAASVSVSGRVTTAKGRGIGKVRISMIDSSGANRTILSNALGYYSFADVLAGEAYIFSAFHKRYSFNESTRIYTITEELNDLDFTANN